MKLQSGNDCIHIKKLIGTQNSRNRGLGTIIQCKQKLLDQSQLSLENSSRFMIVLQFPSQEELCTPRFNNYIDYETLGYDGNILEFYEIFSRSNQVSVISWQLFVNMVSFDKLSFWKTISNPAHFSSPITKFQSYFYLKSNSCY